MSKLRTPIKVNILVNIKDNISIFIITLLYDLKDNCIMQKIYKPILMDTQCIRGNLYNNNSKSWGRGGNKAI